MKEYWDAIRRHYAKASVFINKSKKNVWAIDPYAWNGLVYMTPIESALWCDIRQSDTVLYPQYPVLNFFVDFANPVAKVAVECDGRHYHIDKEKDAARDARLTELGWTVYRIPGSACKTEQNQETGESSVARQFIDMVASNHGLRCTEQRKKLYTGAEAIQTYLNTICEMYEIQDEQA